MACSPGGRFCRLSLIFTPLAAAERVAVPTLCPWPFCRFTVLGAGDLASLPKAGATTRKIMAVSITASLWILEVIIFPGILHFFLEFDNSKDCTRIYALRKALSTAEDHSHWRDGLPSWNG